MQTEDAYHHQSRSDHFCLQVRSPQYADIWRTQSKDDSHHT